MKIAASALPARVATVSRSRSIAVRAAAMPWFRRSRSRGGSSAARSGGGAVAPCRWWAGPNASPAEAGTPVRTSPAAGGRDVDRRAFSCLGWLASQADRMGGGAARRPPGRRRTPRPPAAPAPAARRPPAGPDALTDSVSPNRAPSATTLVRLVAFTGAPSGALGHPHVGVEPPDGLDEPCRRARVQPDRVADLEHGLGVGRWRGLGVGRRRSVGATELRGLHRERAAGLGGHLVERRATARRCRGRHRPLDQRRLAQHDPSRRFAEQVDGELGAHQRAPEIHQHEHPVGGHRLLDRRHHARRVGAEHPRLVGPAGGDRAPGPRHPSRARA